MKKLTIAAGIFFLGIALSAVHAQSKIVFRFISNADFGDQKYELKLSWCSNGPSIVAFNFDNPPWELADTLRHGEEVVVPRVLLEHSYGISIKAEVFDLKSRQRVAGWDTIPRSDGGSRALSSFFQGGINPSVRQVGVYSFFYQGGERLGKEFEWRDEGLWGAGDRRSGDQGHAENVQAAPRKQQIACPACSGSGTVEFTKGKFGSNGEMITTGRSVQTCGRCQGTGRITVVN